MQMARATQAPRLSPSAYCPDGETEAWAPSHPQPCLEHSLQAAGLGCSQGCAWGQGGGGAGRALVVEPGGCPPTPQGLSSKATVGRVGSPGRAVSSSFRPLESGLSPEPGFPALTTHSFPQTSPPQVASPKHSLVSGSRPDSTPYQCPAPPKLPTCSLPQKPPEAPAPSLAAPWSRTPSLATLLPPPPRYQAAWQLRGSVPTWRGVSREAHRSLQATPCPSLWAPGPQLPPLQQVQGS